MNNHLKLSPQSQHKLSPQSQHNLSPQSQREYTCDINAPLIPIDARPVQISGRNRDCTNDEGFWCAADVAVALLGGVRAR